MKRGQNGFGVIETLLVLILLSIVGFTGYYVYHSQKNSNSSYNNAAKANNSKASSAGSATQASPEFERAVMQAQTVYDADTLYISSSHDPITTDWGQSNGWTYLDIRFISGHKDWFSTSFLNKALGIELDQTPTPNGLLQCVNATFDKMTAVGETNNGLEKVVKVTESGQSTKTFKATMVLQNDQWVIDKVDLSGC